MVDVATTPWGVDTEQKLHQRIITTHATINKSFVVLTCCSHTLT